MTFKVTVNPNPFTSDLTVFIHSQMQVNVVIRLLNSKGRSIRVASCAVTKGENKMQLLNLARFASGNYFLEIKLLNGDLLKKIDLVKI